MCNYIQYMQNHICRIDTISIIVGYDVTVIINAATIIVNSQESQFTVALSSSYSWYFDVISLVKKKDAIKTIFRANLPDCVLWPNLIDIAIKSLNYHVVKI